MKRDKNVAKRSCMQREENINFIHELAIVDNDVKIGHMSRIWRFTHVQGGATIGSNCSLGQNVYIGKNVYVGNGCKIQSNVFIPTGVTIENDVFLGPGATFTNIKNPDARIDQKGHFLKTTVKSGVSIGANATILPGITIGEDAVVGAGSVVTKDIREGETFIGNPARKFDNRRSK